MNTITTEVLRVTTQQQAKNADWVEQDEICKAAQAWVEKANAANEKRMKQESANDSLLMKENTPSPDPIGQALADCEIMMTMEKLLRLVRRFWQVVQNRIRGIARLNVSANFLESRTRPTVVDHHNPAIKLVLQAQEILACIIDGGSGVNAISTNTCPRLGITDWEACLF